MEIGGILLGAGMMLEVQQGDYQYGEGPVRFTITTVKTVTEDWDGHWVLLEGQEKLPHGPWRVRHIKVRTTALKRSLITKAA